MAPDADVLAAVVVRIPQADQHLRMRLWDYSECKQTGNLTDVCLLPESLSGHRRAGTDSNLGGQGGICVNNCSYETDLTDAPPPKIKRTAEIRWNGGAFPSDPLKLSSKFKGCVIHQNELFNITISSKESGQLLYSPSDVFIAGRQPVQNVILCHWTVIRLLGQRAGAATRSARLSIWSKNQRVLVKIIKRA